MAVLWGNSTQSIPPWMEDEARKTMEKSGEIAREPYPTYPATLQRIAPINQTLENSYRMGRRTGAYDPYFQYANRLTAVGARNFPRYADAYMNPYLNNVVNNIATYGNRNFTENIMPALAAHFTALGQHGSSRHADLAARAARDSNEAIMRQQGSALAQGYDQAANTFGTDQARTLQAGRQAADLGRFAQAANIADTAALQETGMLEKRLNQEINDDNFREFWREKNYPMERLGQHASIIHGTPFSSQTTSVSQSMPTPQPQVNTWGQLGSLAGQLYGANMAYGRKSGGPVMPKRKKEPFGLSGIKFKQAPSQHKNKHTKKVYHGMGSMSI